MPKSKTKIKLKPCPFCGAKVTGEATGQSEDGHYVWCQGCGAAGPDWLLAESGKDAGARNNDEAREAWNQRKEN